MVDDVATVRTTLGISAIADPTYRRELKNVAVEATSEYSWIPEHVLSEIGIVPVRVDRFETADGIVLDRPVGFAILDVAGASSATIVVFAKARDAMQLGAHGLEGMNLRIDPVKRALVPAGPVAAAAGA
jgi:hypothetical protein